MVREPLRCAYLAVVPLPFVGFAWAWEVVCRMVLTGLIQRPDPMRPFRSPWGLQAWTRNIPAEADFEGQILCIERVNTSFCTVLGVNAAMPPLNILLIGEVGLDA